MTLITDLQERFEVNGIKSFGIGMPFISTIWTNPSADLPNEVAPLVLETTAAPWAAPFAGTFILTHAAQVALNLVPADSPAIPAGSDVANRIVLPDGTTPTAAAVLRMHPQAYLRLVRLYVNVLEGRNDDHPLRPVPFYVVYTEIEPSGDLPKGAVATGETLNFTGRMTIHDIHGRPIDPIAVASMLRAILIRTPILSVPTITDISTQTVITTIINNRQIGRIGLPDTNLTGFYLIDPHGKPLDDVALLGLTGLQAVAGTPGLFTLNAGAITRGAGFPNVRFGPATNGTLDTIPFAPPTIPPVDPTAPDAVRDFFHIMAADLRPFLVGAPATGDRAAIEDPPTIRHNETVTPLFDGNAVLGSANDILSGNRLERIAVAPDLEGGITLPVTAGAADAEWPSFPPGLDTTNDAIRADLRDALTPFALFIGDSPDVVLTLNGLTSGQAIRVFNRVFLPDALEGRGDGAGTVVRSTDNGTIQLLLKDPLGLRQGDITLARPPDPVLHVDLIIVNSQRKGRVFGNVVCAIGEGGQAPAVNGDNPFDDTNVDRGIGSAPVNGIVPDAPLTLPPNPGVADFFNFALALVNLNTQPREAPRLPTMARRESVVASLGGPGDDRWRAQVGGAHLVGASLSAQLQLGAPGGPGGPEFDATGIQIVPNAGDNSPLAYDLARAALRRALGIENWLLRMSDARWLEPLEATTGTVSGAMLQTLAPRVDSAELSFVPTAVMPNNWQDLVQLVQTNANALGLPAPLLNTITTQLNNIQNNAIADHLYEEFRREVSIAHFGRQDARRALKRAIESARDLIYIEAPALANMPAGDDDLFALLQTRLQQTPSLRVILCLSKKTDYGRGYEMFAANEFLNRKDKIKALQEVDRVQPPPDPNAGSGSASELPNRFSRVVAYHPVGFPGRARRLMTNIVIVDDVWAMVGSSTLRQRGLTFDGGLDVVFFDRAIQDGRGALIGDFRRRLMARYLNVVPPAQAGQGEIPAANFVRLSDGHSAFLMIRDLLDKGGIGLIEPLFDGNVPGVPPLTNTLPEQVVNPNGEDLNVIASALIAALALLSSSTVL